VRRDANAMNVREGMRRLGLVLGALGAAAGAVVAYIQLQPVLAQRAQYKTFQSLAVSPVVQKELEFLKTDTITRSTGPPNDRLGPWSLWTPVPNDWPSEVSGPWSRYGDTDKPTDPYAAYQVPVGWLQHAEASALGGSPEGWRVDAGRVRAIHFWKDTDDGKVNARWAGNVSTADISDIETENGQKVYRTEPPSFWSYLLIPVFPVMGFFLPWGAIKTLTWVGVGFSQSGKREPQQGKE